MLFLCYAGAIEDGKEKLQPLREFGDSIADAVQLMPYTAWQQSFDDRWAKGYRNYWKSHFLQELSDEAIETMVEYADPLPTPLSSVFLEWMGGAISQADADATAFAHRDKAVSFTVAPKWSDPERDDEFIAWAREFHEAMAPYAADGVYVNYVDQDEERVRDAYGDWYERLVDLKTEWDPGNLFRVNQNIEPAD